MKTQLLKTSFLLLLLSTMVTNVASAYTAVASGNWSSSATWFGGIAPGPNVTAQDIIIPSGITVLMDMDVTFTGVLNNFTVDGVLNSTAGSDLTISQGTINGSGVVSLSTLTFELLGTSGFGGVISVENLVNDGATLALSSVVELADTLDLRAGNLILNAGANLVLGNNSTVKVDQGSIAISGGILNSDESYNLMYYGSSKVAGAELNSSSLQDLHINLTDNEQTLTVNSTLTVNGDLFLNSGELDFSGNIMTLRGAFNRVAGTLLTSSQLSELVLTGTSSMANLVFSAGSVVNSLTVDRAGSVATTISSALGVVSELSLADGILTLASGGTLTLGPNSTVEVGNGRLEIQGTGALSANNVYNVVYNGTEDINTGIELTGTGLQNVSLDLEDESAEVDLNSDLDIDGTLELVSGTLDLNGFDLDLTGVLTQSANAVIEADGTSDLVLNLDGLTSGTLAFDESDFTLNNLTINFITTPGTLELASDAAVNGTLTLTNAILDLGDNDLTINGTGAISGVTNTSYIATTGQGVLNRIVNVATPFVEFPVGTLTDFAPAAVQQVNGATSGMFSVRVQDGVFAQGEAGADLSATESVVNKTWMIDAAAGTTVNTNIRLGWEVASEVNGFDRARSFISHFVNSGWDTYAEAAATAGANSTFQLVRNGLTSLSPFTVADMAAALGIEESGEAVVTLFPNPATDALFIEALKGGDFTVEILDLSGRIIRSGDVLNGSQKIDISDLDMGTYMIRILNQETKESATRKFVKA